MILTAGCARCTILTRIDLLQDQDLTRVRNDRVRARGSPHWFFTFQPQYRWVRFGALLSKLGEQNRTPLGASPDEMPLDRCMSAVHFGCSSSRGGELPVPSAFCYRL
jgi:hypothetical protein